MNVWFFQGEHGFFNWTQIILTKILMLQSLCLSFIYNPLNQHKKENIKGNTERLQLLQQVDSLLSSLNWLCVCVTVLEFCVLESLKILCFGFSCDFYCLELLVYCFQVFELLLPL